MKRLLPLLLLAVAACSNAPSFEGAYERGVAALEAGDPRTARVEFLNALKANPNSKAARLKQAEALIALGDGEGARTEIERARALGLSQEATAHLMAHALLLLGDTSAALEEAQVAAPAHQAYALRIAGRALTQMGDYSRAEIALNEALAADADDPALWTDIARLRRASGDIAGAIQAADKAVVLDREFVEALVLRGELTRGQYGLKAALPWFGRALEIDPNDVNARLERAVTLAELGRMSEMLRDARKVLETEPDNPVAYYLQAVLAARAGKFQLASALYDRTAGRMDDQPAAQLLAGALDYRNGNEERAVRRLAQLVAAQPDNARGRRLLAAAQWRMGDAAAVVQTLQPLAERADADTYVLSLMARAVARQGDGEGAAYYAARAAEPQQRAASATIPDSGDLARLRTAAARGGADAQVRLIRGLIAAGMAEDALAQARALQAEHPGAPDAHVLVGDALTVTGSFREAAGAYQRAANIAFTEPNALRLVEALQRSGQTRAAGDVLALFLDQNPRSIPAQLIAAGRYMQARQFGRAALIYEDVRLRLGDRDAALLNNLAWAYTELDDFDRALPLARKAWLLNPNNPATADTYGWLLVKSGRDRMRGLALLHRSRSGG